MPDLLHPPGCKFIAINSDKSFYSIFRNSHASMILSSIGMEFSTEFTEQQSFIQQFSKFFHFCSSIIIYYFCPTYFYLNVGDRNFEKRLFLKKFSFKLWKTTFLEPVIQFSSNKIYRILVTISISKCIFKIGKTLIN